MASLKTGTNTCTTTTTYNSGSLGFTPTALIVETVDNGSVDSFLAGVCSSISFVANGDSCSCSYSAIGSGDNSRVGEATSPRVDVYNGAGTVVFRADITFNADDFDIAVTTIGSATTLAWTALAAEYAHVNTLTSPTSAGNMTISDATDTGDLILLLTSSDNGDEIQQSFGWSDASSNLACNIACDDSGSDGMRNAVADACLVCYNCASSPTVQDEATTTSFNATGAVVNYSTTTASADIVGFMILKGAFAMGQWNTSTSGDVVSTGLSDVTGILTGHAWRGGTSLTDTAPRLYLGMADGASPTSISTASQTNFGTPFRRIDTVDSLLAWSEAASPTMGSNGRVSSLSGGDVTYAWTSRLNNTLVNWLAFDSYTPPATSKAPYYYYTNLLSG